MEELRKALNTIVNNRLNSVLSIAAQVATVTSVDKDKCKCDVKLSNGIEIKEVNLRAVLDDNKKGFVIFPKVNSMVLIGTIENNENNAFVLMCSEITDVTIDAKIVINDGNNKGMVKLPELIEQVNKLENKVNEILTWTSIHTHPVPSLGTSGVAVGVMGTLTLTTENDLENKDIKH